MRIFNLIRILFAGVLIWLCIHYARLSGGIIDTSKYVISNSEHPLLNLTGDYAGEINILDTNITVSESLSFAKDSILYSINWNNTHTIYYPGGGYGAAPASSMSPQDSLRRDSVIAAQKVKAYLYEVERLGWLPNQSADSSKISLKRNSEIPYSMGMLQKTKRLYIPILFTDVHSIVYRAEHLGYHDLNDTLASVVYDGDVSYLLSPKSSLVLKAREGLVNKLFPMAEKYSVLDSGDNDVYVFDLKFIGSTLHQIQSTTTVNVDIINPKYNNPIGRMVKDWSMTQIILWTITTLLALFADKIKDFIFNPTINKLFPKKRNSQDAY